MSTIIPKAQLSDAYRLALIRQVTHLVYHRTVTFEDIGMDLAYLLMAMADPEPESYVDWSVDVMSEPPKLYSLLRDQLPADHAVFQFIAV